MLFAPPIHSVRSSEKGCRTGIVGAIGLVAVLIASVAVAQPAGSAPPTAAAPRGPLSIASGPADPGDRVVLVPLPAPLFSGAGGLVLVAIAQRRFRRSRYRR